MTETLWMIAYEQVAEELYGERIDEAEAARRLKALGFDPEEIEAQISAQRE